jgi:hypothetical protein
VHARDFENVHVSFTTGTEPARALVVDRYVISISLNLIGIQHVVPLVIRFL